MHVFLLLFSLLYFIVSCALQYIFLEFRNDTQSFSVFTEGVTPISWRIRMDIAVDVARGLSYLHSFEPMVIYRDLKASNILLDSVSNFLSHQGK